MVPRVPGLRARVAPGPLLASLLAPLLAFLAGCAGAPSADEVAAWRAAGRSPPEAVLAQPAEVDSLRGAGRLEEARGQALAQLARAPGDPQLLWRASRAESDLLVLLAARSAPREERDLAATSAALYAREAAAQGGEDPALQGQLAWALGATVHLRPMLARGEQAQEVWQAAHTALRGDPDQATASAALATLHLRLATLPWIARLFAGDAPEGDLAEAERLARRAQALEPGLEPALLLARVLRARERPEEALAVLERALAASDQAPRDAPLRGACLALADELREE